MSDWGSKEEQDQEVTVRPLVLLEVDGVLNALAEHGDPHVWEDWQSGRATVDGVAYPIVFAREVVKRVLSWHEQDLAEVRWLTTWMDAAQGELSKLLGLPRFPVVGSGLAVPRSRTLLRPDALASHADVSGAAARDALTGAWWKADLVFALLHDEPGRPCVWIDDDLPYELALRSHLEASADGLLVAPPPAVGLTPSKLRAVDRWLVARAPAGA